MQKEYELTQEELKEFESFTDAELVSVWKRFYTKAKRVKKTSTEYEKYSAIANYSMKLHQENIKR